MSTERDLPGSLIYRPDIDGLRAIAVAAVILFHAGVPGFHGGYVGVDIFFVISGYLITLLLIGSSRPLLHRLSEFYMRRCRRILPALLVTSLVTAAAATAILVPSDLVTVGKYLVFNSLLLTNVVAWRQGDYFSGSLLYSPLNHLWSIAVEEQFYLVYPITLVIIGRCLPRRRLLALTVLAAVSLALCIWVSHYRPGANYYLAPPRAWELLLGAIVAIGGRNWIRHGIVSEALAVASLLSIALSVGWYSPAVKYPGIYTILPCLAAAALIAVGRAGSTLVSRLLSVRPLVFTGLISYSLYLWHLPTLVFFSYYTVRNPTPIELVALFASMYVIAVVSFSTIEKPFRVGALLGSDRSFLLSAAMISTALLAVGLAFWESAGFPQRVSAQVQHLIESSGELHVDAVRCVNLPVDKIESGELCRYGPEGNGTPTVVAWGDSHAAALLPAYERLAQSHSLRLYFAAAGACSPILGAVKWTQDKLRQASCTRFSAAMTHLIRRLSPDLVVLTGYWIQADAELVSQPAVAARPDESTFKRGLEETVRQIRRNARSVCVVLDVPTLKFPEYYLLALAYQKGVRDELLGLSRAEAMQQQRTVEGAIRTFEHQGLLMTADPKEALCRTDRCDFHTPEQSLYRDNNHLSVAGAEYVSSTLEACFRDVPSSRPEQRRAAQAGPSSP